MRLDGVGFDAEVFCDWLSINQTFPYAVPVLRDGVIVRIDNDGQKVFETAGRYQHVGSHDTSVVLRSDGRRVELSGNVGAFGRACNTFGYSVTDCVRIANKILAEFDLPPFGYGETRRHGSDVLTESGARIAQVHLTVNFACGSVADADRFLHFLGGRTMGRHVAVTRPGSVAWGYGSKFYNAIAYNKAVELRDHQKGDDRMSDWLLDQGCIRLECKLKSRYLTQKALYKVGAWEAINSAAVEWTEIFGKVLRGFEVNEDRVFDGLPPALRRVANDWLNGVDLRAEVSPATWYRWRAALKKYGIDIRVPCDVTRLPIRVRVLDVKPLSRPDWYDLPAVSGEIPFYRLAA